MTISVIIPIYDVEKYIGRCLESVIAQKCDGFDIECILVDDCTPDHSMDIVRTKINHYHGNDISFVTISHEVNKGLSAARNTGILAAKGELLFFLDSDDMITDDAFYCLLSHFFSYYAVDVVMGNTVYEETTLSKKGISTDNYYSLLLLDDRTTFLKMLLRRKLNRFAWNKLVRRSFILDNNLFFDVGILYEDVIWTYRLFCSISSFLLVPSVTYVYKYNPFSILHTRAKRATQVVNSLSFICNWILNNPPREAGRELFYIEHRLFIFHSLIVAIDCKERYGVELGYHHLLLILKRRLFLDSIKHFHLLLGLFFLLMFAPFKSLLKFRWFRANYEKIEKIIYALSW